MAGKRFEINFVVNKEGIELKKLTNDTVALTKAVNDYDKAKNKSNKTNASDKKIAEDRRKALIKSADDIKKLEMKLAADRENILVKSATTQRALNTKIAADKEKALIKSAATQRAIYTKIAADKEKLDKTINAKKTKDDSSSSINREDASLKKLNKTLAKNSTETKKATKSATGFSKANHKASMQVMKLKGNLAQLSATFVTFYAGIQAFKASFSIGTGFIESAAQFEDLKLSIDALSVSSKSAEKNFNWIKKFANEAPVDIKSLSTGMGKALAYGLSTADRHLRTWADTAAAIPGKTMDQVVDAIADAVVNENERLKEFGVKAKTMLDKVAYSYTSAKGKQMKILVNNTRKEIEDTLQLIFESKYLDQAILKATTFTGQVTLLGNKWTVFRAKVAEDTGLFDNFKSGTEGLIKFIDSIETSKGSMDLLGKSINTTVNNVAGIIKGIVKFSVIVSDGIETVKMFSKAFISMSKFAALGFYNVVFSIRKGLNGIEGYLDDLEKKFIITFRSIQNKAKIFALRAESAFTVSYLFSSEDEKKRIFYENNAKIDLLKKSNSELTEEEIMHYAYKEALRNEDSDKTKNSLLKINDLNKKYMSELNKDFKDYSKSITDNTTSEFILKGLKAGVDGFNNSSESIKNNSEKLKEMGKQKDITAQKLIDLGAKEVVAGQKSANTLKMEAKAFDKLLQAKLKYLNATGREQEASTISLSYELVDMQNAGLEIDKVRDYAIARLKEIDDSALQSQRDMLDKKLQNDLTYFEAKKDYTNSYNAELSLYESELVGLGYEKVKVEELKLLKAEELKQKYAEIHEQELSASVKWEDGITRYLNNVKKQAEDMASFSENALGTLVDGLTEGFSTFFDGTNEKFLDMKSLFQDVTKSVLTGISQMITKMLVMKAVSMFTGGASGGAAAGAVTAFARGGVIQGGRNVENFARGGIVSSPTYFPMAGNTVGKAGEVGKSEGIFQLDRDNAGNLGLKAPMPTNPGPNVSINIINNSSAQVSQEKNSQGGYDIKIIDKELAAMANNGRSSMDRVSAKKYKLNRR